MASEGGAPRDNKWRENSQAQDEQKKEQNEKEIAEPCVSTQSPEFCHGLWVRGKALWRDVDGRM